MLGWIGRSAMSLLQISSYTLPFTLASGSDSAYHIWKNSLYLKSSLSCLGNEVDILLAHSHTYIPIYTCHSRIESHWFFYLFICLALWLKVSFPTMALFYSILHKTQRREHPLLIKTWTLDLMVILQQCFLLSELFYMKPFLSRNLYMGLFPHTGYF